VRLTIAEIHTARAEDELAEALVRQVLDMPPVILGQTVNERRRASLLLAAGLAARKDFEAATPLLDYFVDVLRLAPPYRYGENSPVTRTAIRISAAFRESGVPEPASLMDLLNLCDIPGRPPE
jgi:hypothetical protein